MAIRAVLFDLDGTLWGREGSITSVDFSKITAIQAAQLAPYFQQWGFESDPSDVIPAFIEALRAVPRPSPEDFSEPPRHPVVRRVLAEFGHEVDDSMAEVFIDVIDDVPFHHFGNAAFPDAAPALTALAARGLKIGAVTNNPKKAARLAREIRDQGLPDVFAVIVSSVDCGWRKPHHEPFRFALAALRLGASETAYVGDTYELDILPALELGMTAVLRSPTASEPDPADRYHTITSLLDLPTLLG